MQASYTTPLNDGDAIPSVVFKCRVRDESIGGENPFTWKDVTSSDLFAGKRTVVFSLPGGSISMQFWNSVAAIVFNLLFGLFTLLQLSHPSAVPRCCLGMKHTMVRAAIFFPFFFCLMLLMCHFHHSFEDAMRALGVDEVYCLSVNDAFVMRQWGLHQGLVEEKADTSNPLNPGNFTRVKLLPDGACKFTRGMGMSCVWDTERGFGERSWRYAVVINDMKIEKMMIEVCCSICLILQIICLGFNFWTSFIFETSMFSPDSNRTLALTQELCPWQKTSLSTFRPAVLP
jgi:thioredoxin-dependent peroxiredoxin